MQPPDIWSDVFALLIAETDVRLRAVYAFFLGVVGSLHKRKRYAGFGDNGGKRERFSGRVIFLWASVESFTIYYMCER